MTKEVKAATRGAAEAIKEGRFCSSCRHMASPATPATPICLRARFGGRAYVDLVFGAAVTESAPNKTCREERLPTDMEFLRLDWLFNFGGCGLSGRFWEPKPTVVDGAKVDNTAPMGGHLTWSDFAWDYAHKPETIAGNVPRSEAPIPDGLIVGGRRQDVVIRDDEGNDWTFTGIPKPPPSSND